MLMGIFVLGFILLGWRLAKIQAREKDTIDFDDLLRKAQQNFHFKAEEGSGQGISLRVLAHLFEESTRTSLGYVALGYFLYCRGEISFPKFWEYTLKYFFREECVPSLKDIFFSIAQNNPPLIREWTVEQKKSEDLLQASILDLEGPTKDVVKGLGYKQARRESYLKALEMTSASEYDMDSIKKQYKSLCKKYHPDMGENSNSQKFLEIQQAYEGLEKERQIYFRILNIKG